MRRLRLIVQRLRAFRLKTRIFSLAYLKSKCKARRDWNSRNSALPIKPALAMSREKSRSQQLALIRKKQHCGRAAALDQRLLLACNPCAGSAAGMVVESYKFQIQGSKIAKGAKNAKSGEIWEREKSWNIVTQVGDEFVTKKVILKKKSKQKDSDSAPTLCEDDPLEGSGSCSSSRYRLSTSSSAADACGCEGQMYSWDKDLSFSGDDRFFDEDRYGSEFLDRLEATAKDIYIDPPSNPGTRLLDDSFFSLDHYVRSVQSAGDKHFPSPDCSSIAALELRSLEKSVAPDPDCGICECGLAETRMPILQGTHGSGFSSERRKKRMGGVPVAKFSLDPYRDYRDSMLAMSAANGMEELSEFQELLQCYLSLNPPEFHATIVEVFTELFWHRLV